MHCVIGKSSLLHRSHQGVPPHESILRSDQGLFGSSQGSGQALPTLISVTVPHILGPQTKHSSLVVLILQTCLALCLGMLCAGRRYCGFLVSLPPFCLTSVLGQVA